MRILAVLCLLALPLLCRAELSVVHGSDHSQPVGVDVKPGAVGIANTEHAIGHVERGAVSVGKVLEISVPPNAVHAPISVAPSTTVAEGAVKASLSTNVESGAVQMPLTANVAANAVQAPVTLNVAKDAVNVPFNLSLEVKPGAIVIKGADVQSGAVQIPWWPFAGGIAGLLGIRVIRQARKRVRGFEPPSWLDWIC